MNKSKKIILVFIMIVVLVASLAINSFAFFIIDGKYFDSHPNIPSVNNTCLVDQNFSTTNPSYIIRSNASYNYWNYSVGSPFYTAPTGDLTSAARCRAFYIPNDSVKAYGLDDYSSIASTGVLILRTQSFNTLSSNIVAGRPLIHYYGVDGIESQNLMGISIRGGALTSPVSNLTNTDYRTKGLDYIIEMHCTDLVSGHSFQVSRGNLDGVNSYGGYTSYYELNDYIASYISSSDVVDGLHCAIVLDYLNVSIDNLDANRSYTHVGFDVCFTWRESYARKTNVVGSNPNNINDLFTPFNEINDTVGDALYNDGFRAGYDDGYNDGFEAVGLFGFIINGVEGFLSAELFPGFSFGLLLMSVCGLGLLIWFLKIFAGG